MRKEGLKDAGLVIAVGEMENGNIDADLGGKVFKKRIAFPGRGKRGSARTLIAYKNGERAFFMFGFSKNERANIDSNELRALKLMAKTLLEKSNAKLKKDLDTKILIEVTPDG
jgi:hypothetical protein